jgi:hypothetical protein
MSHQHAPHCDVPPLYFAAESLLAAAPLVRSRTLLSPAAAALRPAEDALGVAAANPIAAKKKIAVQIFRELLEAVVQQVSIGSIRYSGSPVGSRPSMRKLLISSASRSA